MKLIAFDVGGKTSVMHYLPDDTSPEAISACIRKSGYGQPKWREIDVAEYAAIRAARPRPAPVADPATGGVMLQPLPPPVPDSAGKLALAVALANYAIQAGVQAGDYRWHGGPDDFSWNGMRFDAPDLIEYAKSLL